MKKYILLRIIDLTMVVTSKNGYVSGVFIKESTDDVYTNIFTYIHELNRIKWCY